MPDPNAAAPAGGDLDAIGALQEPMRRALYDYVAGQPRDVSRDAAGEAVGIQRALAAFHLDKLVEAGLLEATFRRLTGRSGPGAGRPAKLYRRSSAEHAVSLPPRHYDVAAELLAEAVEQAGDDHARQSLSRVARRFGERIGAEIRGGLAPRASRDRRIAALAEALDRRGYETRRSTFELRLNNCPFHALTDRHRDLVCSMNLSIMEGVLAGMETPDMEARSDPRPGECCVALLIENRRTQG